MDVFYSVKKIDGGISAAQTAGNLIKNLPEKVKAHVLKYTDLNARLNSAAAWNLLDEVVQKAFGASLDGVDFSEDKPTIRGFYIGISHTKGLAVAAAASENFGVDFERIDFTRDADKLKKFLKSGATATDGLFEDWCKREAAIKFYGNVKSDFGNLKFLSGTEEIFGENYAYAFSFKKDIVLIRI